MKHLSNLYIIFLFLIFSFNFSQSQNIPSLRGRVLDANTDLPLIGANIIIENSSIGSSSDNDGYFELFNLDDNIYTLKITYIGYITHMEPDVIVRSNTSDFYTIKLNRNVLEMNTIDVGVSFFTRSNMQDYENVSFTNEEIRRAPGSASEISRILNSLPSVASVGENRQDLMVRGGGPTENGFIIDNIPIPSISHFNQTDGRSNGPIGLINTEMVENIDFYANGFSSIYGNKLSSFADISYREGNRNNFEGNLYLGAGGLGFLIEGPLSKKITFITSLRKSYLDLLADFLNAGGFPAYSDIQGKLTYNHNTKNKFTFLSVNGNSLYDRSKEDAIEINDEFYGSNLNEQQTLGFNWQRNWLKRGYTKTSFSYSLQKPTAEFFNFYTDTTTFRSINQIDFVSFRQVTRLKVSNFLTIMFGLDATNSNFNYNFLINNIDITKQIGLFNSGVFFNYKYIFKNNFVLSNGIRIEYNDYEDIYNLSPRFNLEYSFSKKSSLIFNSGVYWQSPPALYFTVTPYKTLKSVKSIQNSISFDYLVTPSTKFSISIFLKNYSNAPILKEPFPYYDPIYLFDELRLYNGIVSKAKSTASGIEFLFEKKRAKNFYGLIGGSIFDATYIDYNGIKRNRNYNYNYLMNIIGGYKPSYKWEVSFRWSIFGGRPYTPINIASSKSTQSQILIIERFNEERTPVYHSLFLRWERRYSFKKTNLVTFFEFWNAYNRKNVEGYFWSNSAGIQEINFFSFLPIGGFELEF